MADLHTHVIPGVDDGAPDLETAIDSLELLFEDGITSVVATPHLNVSNPRGRRRQLADANWPQLVETAGRRLPGLSLHRGFELQLDEPDPDLGDPELRLARSRFALVEFQAFTIPWGSARLLGGIRQRGVVPILAHPERYWGYDRDLKIVPEWRAAGALLQVNSESLLGGNGGGIRDRAREFLRRGWIDIIASDNHGRPARRPSLRTVRDHLEEAGLSDTARQLLSTNPRRVLADEMPFEVEPVDLNAGLLSRLARMFRGIADG